LIEVGIDPVVSRRTKPRTFLLPFVQSSEDKSGLGADLAISQRSGRG
jgi:hypothetical protein